MTAFAAVVAAIAQRLSDVPAVCDQVHRSRSRPAAQEWRRMVVVRPLDAVLDAFVIQGAPFNVDTRIAVECYGRAASGQSPEEGVDSLLGDVYARLAMDPTLGGLVADLTPSTLTYDFDAEVEATAVATLTYIAKHRVQAQSLE